MTQHQIWNRRSFIDFLLNEYCCFSCCMFTGKFFEFHLFSYIFQILSKAFCVHPQLVHPTHSWAKIWFHFHGKLNIIFFTQILCIKRIQVLLSFIFCKIDTAVTRCCRSASAAVHHHIAEPVLIAAYFSVYHKIIQNLFHFCCSSSL